MILLAAATALATVPEGRTELLGDVGIMQGQLGIGAGVGAAARRGAVVALGTATVAARTALCGDGGICVLPAGSRNPAAGLWTLALAADAETGSVRFGVVGLVDGAVLDVAEEGCQRRGGCRHELWVDHPRIPVGVSFAPAAGIRITGVGASGTRFATTLAVQPTERNDVTIALAPRLDLVADLTRDLSVHWWAGRYGMVVGLGYRLSPPT